MTKLSTHQLAIIGLAAHVFFNVFSNGTVKVVKRWKDASKGNTYQYHATWMGVPQARKVYKAYAEINKIREANVKDGVPMYIMTNQVK